MTDKIDYPLHEFKTGIDELLGNLEDASAGPAAFGRFQSAFLPEVRRESS